MTLDKEEHRAVLLEVMERSAFPGKFAEDVVEIKEALKTAKVEGLRTTTIGLKTVEA